MAISKNRKTKFYIFSVSCYSMAIKFRSPDVTDFMFIDIETVPLYKSLEEAPDFIVNHFKKRNEKIDESNLGEAFINKSALNPLYSRIACIVVGYFIETKTGLTWYSKALYGLNEKYILLDFVDVWDSFFNAYWPISKLLGRLGVVGQNIMEFDLPFIGRRLIINNIEPSGFFTALQVAYSNNFIVDNICIYDTKIMWNHGAKKEMGDNPSLETLANVLNIRFKKRMDYKEIQHRFNLWVERGDESIFMPVLHYCQDDVKTTAEVFLRMQRPKRCEEALEVLSY